ncbi:hypothetical protein [Thermospira aquatica]|uniref:ABC transporter permease n=1 Tax=Thermospira aquatica TaxID=2828656 RepID=A0AAX3BDT1_9SPIR|nr:hypothetical protein [Thermospira aquatica]URA10467.1 hypothetical protein KDW03_01305 [Thermospira aquatica]
MNLKRVWRLFVIDFRLLYKRFLWMLLLIALVFLVMSFILGWLRYIQILPQEMQQTFHLGGDMLLFGFLWCLLSSFSFWDLHNQPEGFYLLLPASQNEKFLSKILGSLIIYPFLAFGTLFVYSLFIMLLIYYLTGSLIPVFLPFYGWIWKWYLFFLVLQAWFFWGSAVFPHLPFVKTAFLIFGASILISLLSTPIFQLLFGTVVSWNGIVLYSTQGIVPPSLAKSIFWLLLMIGKIGFYISGFLGYWLAYRSFCKHEVSYGV